MFCGALMRIAVFSLDSLASNPALNLLFSELRGRIGLVVASRRFGGKYGGVWTQARRTFARSGWQFLDYLGVQYFWYRPVSGLRRLGAALRLRAPRHLSLKQLARRAGAELLATADPNDPAVVARIKVYDPDLILVVHFDHVIKKPLIALPRLGVVNIHPSLLPEYRGPFPVFWALRHGAPRVGVSVHAIVDEALDTGPILLQRTLALRSDDTVLSLDRRLLVQGVNLVVASIDAIARGAMNFRPQLPGEGSYMSYPAAADVRALRAAGRRLFAVRDIFSDEAGPR
jgi:folate-dependent phosphoribosylglycinamide formyltransferase PurN